MQRWEPRPSGAAAIMGMNNVFYRGRGILDTQHPLLEAWKWDDLAVSAGLCWRCRFRSNSAQPVPESPPQFWVGTDRPRQRLKDVSPVRN
jgi:hypothetical protein